MGVDDPERARECIDHLITAVGCPTRLGQVGVNTEADLETIVHNVNTERLKNNPRALSPSNLRTLLKGIQ